MSLYELDYHDWVSIQVRLLRNKQFDDVDWENLIQEVDSLGQSKRDALTEQIVIFYMNMLRWEYQPGRRHRSWMTAVKNAQIEIDCLLEDNPSLHQYLGDAVSKGYTKARKLAAVYADLPVSVFPLKPSPITLELKD